MKKIMLGIMLVLFAIAVIADTVIQETDIQATATTETNTTAVVEPVLISANPQCNQFREIRVMKLISNKIVVLSTTKVCIPTIVKEYNDWCTYNGMITTIYNYGGKQKGILQGKFCENRNVVGGGISTPLPVNATIPCGNCTV